MRTVVSNYLNQFIFCIALICLLSASAYADFELDADQTDFDADGKDDLITYDASIPSFFVRRSSDLQLKQFVLGSVGDVDAVGDFNSDGKADLTTFNRSTAVWTVFLTDVGLTARTIGSVGDIPVPADYRGLGCSSFATYNPRVGVWTITDCNGDNPSQVLFGGPGKIPVPADYDCDGTIDLGTFDRSTGVWEFIRSSTGGVRSFQYGLPGDIPLPGDYEGTGCHQPAVHRPGVNYRLVGDTFPSGDMGRVKSVFQWGLPGDNPVHVSVDGDDRSDLAVFRPITNTFELRTSVGSDFLNLATSPFALNGGPLPTPIHESPVLIEAAPGDFNRDGISDFAFAKVDRGRNRTTVDVEHGGTGSESSYTLNAAADAFVHADYDGDGTIDPAIVNVQSTGLLAWHRIAANGSEVVELFGLNGDQPLAGDFDCDGKADKAVVRTVGGFKYWFFAFARGGAPVDNLLFGFSTDTVYTADINGDGCNEMVVSRERAGGIDWWHQDILGGQPQFAQWGLVGDKLLVPEDVNGDGDADFLVHRGGQVFARLADGVGTVFNVPAGDFIVTGRFSGLTWSEFASYSRDRNLSQFIIRRGNAFDEVVNTGDATANLLLPDGSVSISDVRSGPNCTTVSGMADGGTGRLWKPVSDNFGTPVVLMPASYWTTTGAIDLFDSDGDKLLALSRRNCCDHNGGRAHYDVFRSASELARNALPLYLRFSRNNGVQECYLIPDPRQRYD